MWPISTTPFLNGHDGVRSMDLDHHTEKSWNTGLDAGWRHRGGKFPLKTAIYTFRPLSLQFHLPSFHALASLDLTPLSQWVGGGFSCVLVILLVSLKASLIALFITLKYLFAYVGPNTGPVDWGPCPYPLCPPCPPCQPCPLSGKGTEEEGEGKCKSKVGSRNPVGSTSRYPSPMHFSNLIFVQPSWFLWIKREVLFLKIWILFIKVCALLYISLVALCSRYFPQFTFLWSNLSPLSRQSEMI